MKELIKVTFFGDSICVGQGISLFKGWVPRIAQRLDEIGLSRGCSFLVSNSSVNGRTTRQALEDMPYHIQAHRADVLLIQFGLNDCNYWLSDNGKPRVRKEAFRENIIEMIERAWSSGTRLVLLNTNHPTARDKELLPNTSITFEDSNREYNEVIRKVGLSLNQKIIFTDIEMAFQGAVTSGVNIREFLLEDGLHLSEIGHNLYFDIMSQTFDRVLEKYFDFKS